MHAPTQVPPMGIQPLTVAIAAAALLVLSVAGDLAFDQRVTVEASAPGGARQLLGDTTLDARYSRPGSVVDPFVANETDAITFFVRFHNEHPWPSSKSFTMSSDGCYEGATRLAVVDVRAPARGTGDATAEITVSRLLGGGSRFEPKPVDAAAPTGTQYAYVQLCQGERYVMDLSVPIREVAK